MRSPTAMRPGPAPRSAGSRSAARRGRHGGDDERRVSGVRARQPREHVESPLRHGSRRLLARVGEAGARREQQRGVAGPCSQRVDVALGVSLAWHDEDGRRLRLRLLPEEGGDDGFRRVADPERDAPALGEPRSHLRKGRDLVEGAEERGEVQFLLLGRQARQDRGAPAGVPASRGADPSVDRPAISPRD